MKLTKKNVYLVIAIGILCGILKTAYLVKLVNLIIVFPYVETPSYSEEYCSFTPEDTYSYDGKFAAHQRVEKGIGISSLERQIIVEVTDSETGKIVSSFSPARAWDFWGICWENDSYNIWIQSGDIGVYCWRYQDGGWECDYSHPERPEYIISKYDKYQK